MEETYGTYVDDECYDIHDYGDDTDHDTDDDTDDDTDGDTDTDDADDGGETCIICRFPRAREVNQYNIKVTPCARSEPV